MKKRLFTPGPTLIPEQVLLAMGQPIIHHRHPEFKEVFRRVSKNLKYLFQTEQDVLTLTSSGTGAMEAAVCNLLSKDDEAIVVNSGKFGERWGEICRTYGVQTRELKIGWGTAVEPQQIEDALKKFSATKALFVTHSETSTGVAMDLKEIAKVVREHSQALFVVDAISSVGALEMRVDAWGIDVVITGSQKGLMLPPGLAFIALSQRAWEAVERSTLPKYYFDFQKAKNALAVDETPWTPAITLILGLDVSLKLIREEGLESIWARHEKLARALRAGCEALELELLAKRPSNALTAVWFPDGIDPKQFNSLLKQKYGVTIAGGQGHLKGKIFRLAHLGYYDESDIIALVSALEMALQECGYEFEVGAGVQAVQREFRKNVPQEATAASK